MIRARWILSCPALALTGCASLPLSYLDSTAPVGGRIAQLGWGMLIISVVVVLIIAGLLVAAIWRGSTEVDGRELAVRRDTGGMRWIYVGVGISSAVLAISAIWTLLTLKAVAQPASGAAPLTIGIVAHQWWWQADYRPSQAQGNFTTANEVHIPVGVPVRFELRSADVIHSFWVPKLAGKTDVIPGRTNSMWVEARQPGIYRGQCAEYCGIEHALMSFRVIAEPIDRFRSWQAAELSGRSPQQGSASAQGAAIFAAHCGACHAMRGTEAGGAYGPDLTNLGSRTTLAAGMIQNTPRNLAYWIRHAQEVKPGARMPNVPLSDADVAKLVPYLEAR
ncbi:cytochrome c oxidase subunit II [Sphingomonas sp. KRR8]|uniref:cytochrome c oxidase subunit II n=1 Tax=Sphingomonas sp. KRR8 TaxID=2942996 RepID=UPI0024C4E424|nr:cytochrome c oxidase subunit II [Sphingomonas sp. KRR8]